MKKPIKSLFTNDKLFNLGRYLIIITLSVIVFTVFAHNVMGTGSNTADDGITMCDDTNDISETIRDESTYKAETECLTEEIYYSECGVDVSLPVVGSRLDMSNCTEDKLMECAKYEWRPYDFIDIPFDTQNNIKQICDKYELPYDLIIGMLWTESRFNFNSVGDNGDSIGGMQIQPRYWSGLANEIGVDLYSPMGNVELGCAIVSKLLVENKGDLTRALKQYNSGNPNYPSNTYVDSVYGYMTYLVEMEAKR